MARSGPCARACFLCLVPGRRPSCDHAAISSCSPVQGHSEGASDSVRRRDQFIVRCEQRQVPKVVPVLGQVASGLVCATTGVDASEGGCKTLTR